MSFDVGDDLHLTKDGIGQHQINKILTKMRRLQAKVEDFVVRRWLTYSPLSDLHDTDVDVTLGDIEEDDLRDSDAVATYTRYPPGAGEVLAYDLIHSVVGTLPDTAFLPVATKFGAGVTFDGNFNFKIDDHDWFNVTDKISGGGWIRPQAFTGTEQILAIKDQQYKIVINASANTIEASVYISGAWGNAVTYNFTPDALIDLWMDWDGTTLELWVGNVLQDSEGRSGSINTTSNDFAIGGMPDGTKRVAADTFMAWWTFTHESVANVSTWLADHLTGSLRTADADEITTMPFFSENPQPDAYEGMFIG